MNDALCSLKNIGPATIRQLNQVGVSDLDTLRRLGTIETYRRLKHAFPREVTLVMAYAIEGALSDCHWNRLPSDRKVEIRQALKGR